MCVRMYGCIVVCLRAAINTHTDCPAIIHGIHTYTHASTVINIHTYIQATFIYTTRQPTHTCIHSHMHTSHMRQANRQSDIQNGSHTKQAYIHIYHYTNANTHTYREIHTHVIHTYIPPWTYIHIYSNRQAYIQAGRYSYTHTHKQSHTHMHTYIKTYMHSRIQTQIL